MRNSGFKALLFMVVTIVSGFITYYFIFSISSAPLLHPLSCFQFNIFYLSLILENVTVLFFYHKTQPTWIGVYEKQICTV